MKDDLFDILTSEDSSFDNQKLIDYLNGQLSGEEKHEIEKWLADHDFTGDAIEGLLQIKEKKHLLLYAEQLNRNLQQQLQLKKDSRLKRKLKEYPWIYFAVIFILLLCILGFLVLKMMLMKSTS